MKKPLKMDEDGMADGLQNSYAKSHCRCQSFGPLLIAWWTSCSCWTWWFSFSSPIPASCLAAPGDYLTMIWPSMGAEAAAKERIRGVASDDDQTFGHNSNNFQIETKDIPDIQWTSSFAVAIFGQVALPRKIAIRYLSGWFWVNAKLGF